jgi:signal recognition particle GTPase
MEIGSHVMQRYVERVLGIDKSKLYAQTHMYEVIYNILKLFNESTLLINNYAPTKKDTFDYYINDQLLIVVDPRKKEIKTLYYVTLKVDSKENHEKVRQYVKLIKTNNNEIKKLKIAQNKQNPISKHLEFMLDRLMDEDIPNELMDRIYSEKEESIQTCKDYAATENRLRSENRDLMTEMFKKLKHQE